MEAIYAIFNFIYSIFDTIYKGIYGIIKIIESSINFVFSIIKILPNPLYGVMFAFVSVYLAIFVYKIFRTGKG